MNIEVCYAEPDRAWRVALRFVGPATISDAIARSALIERLGLDPAALRIAIYGKLVALDTILADGDRVELLRPLVVEPKEARRQRVKKKASGRSRG